MMKSVCAKGRVQSARQLAEKLMGKPAKYSTITNGTKRYTAETFGVPLEIRKNGSTLEIGHVDTLRFFDHDIFEPFVTRDYLGKGNKITRIKTGFQDSYKIITQTIDEAGKKHIKVHYEFKDPKTNQITTLSEFNFKKDYVLSKAADKVNNAYSSIMDKLCFLVNG